MTQRTRKARFPVGGRKEIAFSEEQWELIEQAYGHQLLPDVRMHILLATEALSLVGNVEQHGPALEKMKTKTKKLRESARSLLTEADWSPPIVACESFTSLTDALATAVNEFPNDHLQFLIMVQCVTMACNQMLGEWESEEGWREGYIWDAWVQGIGELMEHHGLPSAARKDSDKRDPERVSPFVSLIKELQKHVPAQLRRHDHPTVTPAALEQAIHRARRSNWWAILLPPKVRERYKSFLESSQERAVRYEQFRQKLREDPNWVERSPGSFVRADSPFEKICASECEQKVASDSQDEDDAAQ
jgi:hypothetical protein